MTETSSSNESLSLYGEQKKVLLLPPKNAVQVKGVAGSGKTTVAIFRARHLIQNYTDLFQTTSVAIFMYTNTLVGYVHYLVSGRTRSDEIDHSFHGITVTNFHKWAWGFLFNRGATRGLEVVKSDQVSAFVLKALAPIRRANPDIRILNKPLEFFTQEISWIKGKVIETERDYLGAKRSGRGTLDRVTKEDRRLIWKVYQGYQDALSASKKIDFDDYALMVLAEIIRDETFAPPFSHIVVDEAQDLTRAQMLVISKLVNPETNSVTVIADAAQKIYKSGFTWSEVGINVIGGRTVEFKENYRNSSEVSAAAQSLLSSDPDQSEFTSVDATNKLGEKPKVISFKSEEEEVAFIVSDLKANRSVDLVDAKPIAA